jgi:hypothetical protein
MIKHYIKYNPEKKFLFETINNKPYKNSETFGAYLKKCFFEVTLKNISVNLLRHSFILHYLKNNTILNYFKNNKIQDIPYALINKDNRDMNYLSKLLFLHKNMGSIDMRKYGNKINFIKETPQIELNEIISFLTNVSNQRSDNYKSVIYINICTNSKFYVGIAYVDNYDSDNNKYQKAVTKRLSSHRNNGGDDSSPTNWTWINPVVSNLTFIKGDLIDENLITLLMVKCVGEDNVRGGDYTDIHKVPDFPNMSLIEIKEKIIDNNH